MGIFDFLTGKKSEKPAQVPASEAAASGIPTDSTESKPMPEVTASETETEASSETQSAQ